MKLLSVTLYLFILIKFTYQTCGIITNLGDMSPVEIDVQVNSDIIFNCTLRPDNAYNSSGILFTHFGKEIDQSYVQILDQHSAQLRIPNANENMTGRYYCNVRNVEEKRTPMVCVSEARVGYKPSDLRVTDFSCKYLYRKEMRCSWTTPANNVRASTTLVQYKLGVRERGYGFSLEGFENVCPRIISGPNERLTCIWDYSAVRSVGYYMEYSFGLTRTNSLGTYEQIYNLNMTSIVQLDPPPNFNFHPEDNTLSWDNPNLIHNDNNLFPLLQFKVLVADPTSNDEQSTVYMIFDNTKNNVTLQLKPYTEYNFTILCKIDDPMNEHWSDSVSILERTKEDAPASSPTLISQAFETSNFNPRSATIYWQSLPLAAMNGPAVEYLISYEEPSSRTITHVTTNHTNYSFDSLNSTPYEFRIYSKNTVGLSREYSSIVLPASSNIIRLPNKVEVISLTNGYKIEWEKLSPELAVKNYTIFWCVAKNDHCTESIHWKFATRNVTLEIPHGNYKFGISANTQLYSSGIYWTPCIVNPKVKVDKLRHVHPLIESSTDIRIKWEFICEAQKRLVSQIQIEYCPIDCTAENRGHVLVDNLNTDQSLVGGLIPNMTYQFTLSAANIAEESHVQGTTDLGVPSSPVNLTIVDSSANMSTIQWNYTSPMLDHFKVQFGGESFTLAKEICQSDHCLYTLPYSEANLKAYTNYSISVSSCNIKGDCSTPGQVYFLAAPSKPGQMLIPQMEKLSASQYRIHFRKPLQPNGPINFYYVRQQGKEPKRYGGNEAYVDMTVECEHTFQMEVFKVQIFASNLVNGEEVIGEPSNWTSIEMCKPSGLLFVFIIMAVIIAVIIFSSAYCAIGYMNTLKMKKKSFQINIQCNQRDEFDPNFEPFEKDALVPEETELNQAIIAERRKISSSVTNASMTSDSSMAENSHSSDKNCPSSSDNCYASDSTANYSDINYRENHEYFLHPMDDSCRPLMSIAPLTEEPSSLPVPEQRTAPETTGNCPSPLAKAASELNRSPVTFVANSSQLEPTRTAKAVYVPLSPMLPPPPAATAPETPVKLNANSSNYVSHEFAAQQNVKTSTNV